MNINNTICKGCIRDDWDRPCNPDDMMIINCILNELIKVLEEECGFNFINPESYRKLPQDKSKRARAIYKEYSDMLNLDPSKPLYTQNGIKIAEGFERLVIGDYGAYIEYDLSQVPEGMKYSVEPGQEYRKLPGWRDRVKYIWYTVPESNPHIKIYWQLRTVTYADYKTKKFYISPFEIMQ